jgi:hypothetical protein
LLTPLLAFLPPAFVFVGMVWRDILFGVIWLAAATLAAVRAQHLRFGGALAVRRSARDLRRRKVLLRPMRSSRRHCSRPTRFTARILT